MKNIHIISTDKPSNLYFDGNLKLKYIPVLQYNCKNCVNIYITNNEEIEEGDWRYDLKCKEIFKTSKSDIECYDTNNCKKIIITSDIDLIKDGVQEINNDFLDWFCSKNGNIDFIDVKKGFADGSTYGYNFIDYKIIIPKN